MGRYGVADAKEAALHKRMADCGIEEAALEERFIQGGGPGGQKVNKTASGVYLKHASSGFEVKMQQSRSQALNRFYARRRLCELIEAKELGEKSPEAKRAEKLRKQKQRRRRKTKKKLQEEE